ncbi:hypothetical protein ACFY1U_39830, partial [Streptomyces sp. NPDC001351]
SSRLTADAPSPHQKWCTFIRTRWRTFACTPTHRARTGQEIDLDALRARLGVPPAMADAIATQLA